ncbi:hypothetical protein KM043_009959 [Ampulex compressa]|nr:hypothetical protein KM043_009959 [Ampulex compressa]
MVKLQKVLQDGGSTTTEADCLSVSGYSTFKGYRRKHLDRVKALRKMLNPRRGGPVSSEEIGNGPESKDNGATGSGAVSPGTYENGDGSKEFLSTGRTGRRNALPDILGRHAETGLSDLPDRFEELSTHTDQANNGGQAASTSGMSKQHG